MQGVSEVFILRLVVITGILTCIFAAPTGPPASVMTTSTPNTFTVQWGPVECADRNGDITGYSVRYGEVGSAGSLQMVGGDMDREATISDLTPSTEYTISVAAVTTAGTGVYSADMIQRTEGEHFPHCLFILNSVHAVVNISPPPYIIVSCFYDPFWDGDTFTTTALCSFLLHLFLLICHPYPTSFHEMTCSTNISLLGVAKLER